MTGSCPVSAHVCQETAREVGRLRDLASWLVGLDDPDGIEERRTVTLTKIIDRARIALDEDGGA